MKKSILAAVFVLGLIFSQMALLPKAEAYDRYIGVYPATGLNAYLMTQTVYRYNWGYTATIVCYPSNSPYYIDYKFWIENGNMYYSNSDGYSGRVRSAYADPIEYNAYQTILSGSY